MPPGDLTREELIDLVERIMNAEGDTQAEADRLVARFEDAVVHPEASGLIFWPDEHFGGEPTAEEVVDRALEYRPIELGPAD